MTNFIPIFLLDKVIYPGETFSLEVTESRYQQLIKDCLAEEKPFGAPVSDKERPLDFGTSIQIIAIKEHKDSNSLTVTGKGLQVFRILEIMDQIPNKPYWGAIVHYPENNQMKVHHRTSKLIFDEVKNLYHQLHIDQQLPPHHKDWVSYELAHKVGLDRQQEYQILCMMNEVQRMEFLRRHLKSISNTLDNIELLKSRISLN